MSDAERPLLYILFDFAFDVRDYFSRHSQLLVGVTTIPLFLIPNTPYIPFIPVQYVGDLFSIFASLIFVPFPCSHQLALT